MNRADRRKQKRDNKKNGCNEMGEKMYHLTGKQLDDIVFRALELKRKEIIEMVTSKVTNTFLLFCMEVLHYQFGFGKRRLKRFKYYMDETAECVEGDYCDTESMLETLSDKMDLEFMYRPIDVEECYDSRYWEKKYGGDYEQLIPYPNSEESETSGVS